MSREPLQVFLSNLIYIYKPLFTHALFIDDTYGNSIKELRLYLFMKFEHDKFSNNQGSGTETTSSSLPSVEESLKLFKEIFHK